MELLVQQVLAGIATGGIYACLALAMVVVYQATDSLNFAQGEMATLATFVAWQLMAWGVPYWAAFCVTLAASFAGGFLVHRLGLGRLRRATVLTHIAIFIGLYVIINGITGSIWESNVKAFPTPFGTRPLLASGILSAQHAGMIAVTAVLLLLLFLFFRHTRVGLAMRAAAANPGSARLVGVRVRFTTALGWGMAAAIGAVAGMLVAPVLFLEPNMMMGVLLYGFAGAVVGGLTSPAGANLAGTFLPAIGRELKLPIALAVVVVVLAVRSGGLFGRRVVARV